MKNIGSYSKFIVTIAGAGTTALETQFAGDHWVPLATAAITALVTYLVPNSAPAPGGPQ